MVHLAFFGAIGVAEISGGFALLGRSGPFSELESLLCLGFGFVTLAVVTGFYGLRGGPRH
jgi:hypothetical protein